MPDLAFVRELVLQISSGSLAGLWVITREISVVARLALPYNRLDRCEIRMMNAANRQHYLEGATSCQSMLPVRKTHTCLTPKVGQKQHGWWILIVWCQEVLAVCSLTTLTSIPSILSWISPVGRVNGYVTWPLNTLRSMSQALILVKAQS